MTLHTHTLLTVAPRVVRTTMLTYTISVLLQSHFWGGEEEVKMMNQCPLVVREWAKEWFSPQRVQRKRRRTGEP